LENKVRHEEGTTDVTISKYRHKSKTIKSCKTTGAEIAAAAVNRCKDTKDEGAIQRIKAF